jgi:hypothetical protein
MVTFMCVLYRVARPSNNMVERSGFAPELAVKQLEILKDTVRHVTRVAVVINPDNPAMGPTVRAVEGAGPPWRTSR